jgi:hypothetical protein
MELAAVDGMEDAFNRYARELAHEPTGPWIRSHYLLFLGEGFHRFGREQEAIEALQEAVQFAEANQVHQVAFKAQSALEGVRSAPRNNTAHNVPPTWVPDDVESVVRSIADLRKATVAAS